jgi:hypothetical protein
MRGIKRQLATLSVNGARHPVAAEHAQAMLRTLVEPPTPCYPLRGRDVLPLERPSDFFDSLCRGVMVRCGSTCFARVNVVVRM